MDGANAPHHRRGSTGGIFFGYEGSPPTLSSTFVSDACEVTLRGEGRNALNLRVYRGRDASIDSGVAHEADVHVYIWGRASHPVYSGNELIEWIGTCAARENWSAYKELVGSYVVILEILSTKRIHFVADALGARPFYYALTPDGVIFGSDVWHLRNIGPQSVSLSHDAISTWLVYGFNCTETSIFNEYKRLAPATVLIIENGKTRIEKYLEPQDPQRVLRANEVAEAVYAMVDRNVRALSRLASHVVIGLSGGYDSRFILGLILKQRLVGCTAVTVESSPHESEPAELVARALGVAQEKIKADGSIWDIYDEPFHFTFDGFPITKQITYQVASLRAGDPVMNGFLGDRVIHGHGATCQGLDETQFSEGLAEALFLQHRQFTFDSYFGKIADRIRVRAMRPMQRASETASGIGDVFRWADLYFRQRLYISNNFHQHLGFSEVFLPFLSGDLIEYYLSAYRSSFSANVYRRIFQDHLPELAAIPHSDELSTTRPENPRPASRRTKGFALEILIQIGRREYISDVSNHYVIPRLLFAYLNPARVEYLVFDLYRIMLLADRLREYDLEIDWGKF